MRYETLVGLEEAWAYAQEREETLKAEAWEVLEDLAEAEELWGLISEGAWEPYRKVTRHLGWDPEMSRAEALDHIWQEEVLNLLAAKWRKEA
jgi:hypothetical protein